MSKMIVGSSEHARYMDLLRSKGMWPPHKDEKAQPLPLSEEKPFVQKAKKYMGQKFICNKMCCQSEHSIPAPPLFATAESMEDEMPPYTGWTKVGKSGKTICRVKEYLTDDSEDLLR